MRVATPDSRWLNGRTILLIEDNDQLYRALRETLEQVGGDVLGALAFMPRGTGLLPLARIDMAIVDTSEGETRWIPLSREMKERNIACLFLAAEQDEEFTAHHHCAYLNKPFTESQFLEAVAEVVRVVPVRVEPAAIGAAP